ncbi:MAG: hypothetical protein AAF802_01840 [Planctomycetota bacterium]
MIPLEFKAARSNFFDGEKIRAQLERKERRALSRVGAFVRRRMRSKIRRRKRASKPGQAPSSHTNGFASLRTIFFAYDKDRSSVVIGPVLLNQRKLTSIGPVNQTVPELLEFSGTVEIQEQSYDGLEWFAARRRIRSSNKPRHQRVRRVRVEQRPFANVSLQEEVDRGTIPAEWKGLLS